jgi:hypothetical protein
MSPAPVALTAQVPGKDVCWLGGIHGSDIPRRSPKEMHLPNPRGETGRSDMQGRRGGRVVEGARLESVFTGDRNAGSNPALSAIWH